MEHRLQAQLATLVLEHGYHLSRVTDKKDGRIIMEIRRIEKTCFANLDLLINLDVEKIDEEEEFTESE